MKNSSALGVCVNAGRRASLNAATEQERTSLGDFVEQRAIELAEAEILNRSVISIAAKDWETFESWLNRPAQANAALKKLVRTTPTWEQ